MTISRCEGRKRGLFAACQTFVRTILVEVKMAVPEAFYITGQVMVVWFMPRTVKSSYEKFAGVRKALYPMSYT